jgi:gamma-glutamylcyclotransferase (GGCT)/AIG2-like uncharacterized protein YtfP
MITHITRLFVYGSLRVGFKDPAYSYLSKYFHLLGEGKVQSRFHFNGKIPVAVPSVNDHISGELYELNNPDELKWVMIQLDDYEGLNVEEGETPLYKREKITVKLADKQTEAWVYWYNRSVEHMPALDASELAAYMEKQKKY